jgi:pilus assembly protein CpaE
MGEDPVLVVEESSVLSDLVRDLLEAAGFSVVQASTSKDALALVEEQKYRAVLVDAAMPKIDGYQVRRQIRESQRARSVPVLLIASTDEARGDAGLAATEYVRKPIDPVDLIVRVRGAVGEDGLNGSTQLEPIALVVPPAVKLSESATPGKIITVYSLKGGVGTSTIAVNLALALKKLWDESIALVDLSLEAGALNILLDIMPTSTLDELVSENGRLTPELVTQYLVPHKSGVSLLSAPPSPERAELVDSGSLRKAISYLRQCFDYVVVDTASNFADHTLMALEMSDHIVLPVIGDISSIRATTTALDIFQALSISDEGVILVFNELFPKAGLSRKNVETSLHATTKAMPFGGGKLLDSVNLGAPIVTADPDHQFSQAIENLAFELSRPDAVDGVPTKQADLLSKVRRRLRA